MRITEEAKLLITEAFASNGCDCLKVSQEESCCGASLLFELVNLKNDEKPAFINGVSVMMDYQAQTKAEEMTLAVENGELIVQDDGQSCCC